MATFSHQVVIAGGGLAGSLASAMLRRANIDAVLVDPHPTYPPEFRCEKLDEVQLETLRLTGLAETVLAAATPYKHYWAARFGRVVEKRPCKPQGIMYDTLVNTLRRDGGPIVREKVASAATSADTQIVTLSNGDVISARLLVVATGLNVGLPHKLGIEREVISANHSISIGFDIAPRDREAFPFSSLTYFADRPADRMAYITVFPVGSAVRVNLFGYRDLHDPWMQQLRTAPQETLYALWPRLRPMMGDFVVLSPPKIRPVDLYVTKNYRQPGIVLVGDAFSTACPAAGTGARKVLVDVERLCNIHIPRWLATNGMGADKIATYYDDPIKRACDALSLKKAHDLRSFSTDPSVRWAVLRFCKFIAQWGRGILSQHLSAAGELQVEEFEQGVVSPLHRATQRR